MYTIRLFKNPNEVNRLQIYLGDSYQVVAAGEEEKKSNILYRVKSEAAIVPKEGLAIYADDHAFIMMPNGETFETITRPEWHSNNAA